MAKFNDIRELAQQNARWVSNSPKDWMNYLDVAARLYRYSFKDTLLIHAQRPDATACAELEVWNKKMNRWVNRGAKGIALLDDASPRAKLRYVFDIADTHLVQGGRTPILWRIDDSEHQQMILDHLADTYALTQTDSMNAALMELAQQLTAENLEEAMDGLEYEVADTFLEGLDEDNLRVRFRELMTNSIFYTLSRRCEQEPLEVLDDEDFIRIVDFNQLPVLIFLGNAVSEQCEAVLRDIGREMQKIYRKEVTEHLAKTADSLYNTSTDFNALKRETETNITEGGKPYGTDLSPQGGLPVSEPDRTGRADEHWEVRDAAQDLSEGKQEELVSEYADERQAESASGADRRAGGEPDGRTDREPEREVSGSEQGNRTDGMGGTSEQSDRDGGRDRAEGIGVQLTADTTEQDLSEAEEEIASAFSLPSLPTVEQQIRAIEAPMQAQYADEITIPAEVVDEILRTGSNRGKSQLRLIYNFMTEQTPEEYTAFVKKEYGEGGKGFEIGGTKYAVWFDELGMQIAVGDTVRNDPKNKAFLSWEDVSCRIHQLLQQGEYAPKSVLDAARGNALHEHAEALSYMERDMAEGVAEMVFADTSIFSGGYPELTERLAKLIDQPEFLADLNERLLGLAEAYAEDKSVMRMPFYRPDKVSEQFRKFALPFQPYQAREGFQWNEQEVFITEDEINAFLAGGGPYSDGRLATYSFFLTHTEKAERAAFLKDRYGVGGSSHALSRADNSHASYDGRGLELARGIYGKPDALVKLNWNQAAERVAKLIDQSLYLKPADYSRMPSYEREQMANRVIGFYHRLPDEVERPFKRELLNEDARKKLPTMLADPEQAVELLEKMDVALLSVPLDSPEYAEKSKTLAELHQYVEGTYTIFPEKKKAVEISVSETGQISLFDIWAQEQESKEHSTTAVVEEPQKQAAKYSRNIGDYLYLEDDRLYKIERVTDSLIYLKDMERPAWAARVLRPNQYDAELAKNPLNDYLLAGQESALKDSRCVYKECLYSMLDAVQQSEIYPYLRDRDVDADEAEKELRNKIDELLEQNAKTAPLYLEASQNWENFKDWLVEDIFQRTYQDVITDRRDAVALYQDSKDAPQWVRGIMVLYAAEEKAVEPTLQPLPLDAVNEYNALKERYPDALVGYEQYGKSFTVKQMEKTKKTLQAKLQKLNDQSRKDDVVTFEQLGVDRLFVDESHFYKNMFLYTKMRNIAGIAQTDAQKSSDMFAKCQYLDEITGGKGVTFATGTPVSNSMVELYTIMRYLQYDTLQKLHLGHFDSWAASFGETVTAIELSPEGTGYRAKTRFARFFNLPELISLFKESADVQTADMLNLPVPEAEYINEVLKPSETQQEMVSSFADRAEQVRNGNVNPKIDNMLKITNDGRKLALDQRLINDLLPDEPESKVNLCVENAYQVWEESTPDKSTQLIFCDLSTPKTDGTFNVYDDVREKLVAKGIPREEIAFIHEANTETKKAELFAKVRSGQVRILLGSTPKLGAGTNIQDRLIALHHLDCPWKPSDLEQQEGRILRQGNRNQKVKIFRYVTENTFDSYMWQILENKQKFISQIMTSKSPVRACDDVDDTALTYAEIKALATGNPYIKEKMDLDIQVSKLKLMRANHTSQIYSLESDIARRYPAEITAAKERIAGLKADLAVAKPLLEQDKEKFSITVEDRVYTDRKEAGSAILAACAAMKIAKTEGQIADLGGFAISSRFDAFAQTFKLTIKRQSSYTIELGSDPAGNIQRILNALASIEKTLPQVERRLETLQQQLAEAKEEVQRPFPQEAELNEKSARLAELNALLDMDEKGDDAALGMDEEMTESEIPAPKREIERSADSVKRPSILAQLHEKQAERMAEPKPQKKKSHDMEL